MVEPEVEARIVRLYYVEKWTIGTIARELSVHHSVVRRVLGENGVQRALYFVRPSLIDSYLPFVKQTLQDYPRLAASRLYQMVRERGYAGAADHFRHIVARLRPRPVAEAFLRLRTLPGEQAQVDWGHFGRLLIGRADRPLYAFVLVLSWSRRLFVRFYLAQRIENFLRGHEAAFADFGGVPRVCLYDNLKSVVLERAGAAIRFHPTFLGFAGHHRFEPRPVAVARGNEKGRVERSIRYLRDSFFAARRVRDLDELNAEVEAWCRETADARRCPGDPTHTVAEAFEHERRMLLPLPENAFPTAERVEITVRKTPYVRFDGNDYSVPHDRCHRTLSVVAEPDLVRIIEGTELVATHARSYDHGHQIEDPSHIEDLVRAKSRARQHRTVDRLRGECPHAEELLGQLALRGENLGSATAALSRLLDLYGASELDAAIAEALAKGAPHPHSVRHILERWRRERGAPPPVAVQLRLDLRALSFKPHALADYDPPRPDDEDPPEPNAKKEDDDVE